MATISIYGLYDSSGVIRYIGKTKNCIKRRCKQHQKNKKWCLGIELLEKCEESSWKSRESYWIGYFHGKGNKLVNKNTGGGGPSKVTEQLRKQISVNTSIAIKKWHDEMPEEKKRQRIAKLQGVNRGRKLTQEHKEKLRQSALRQWRSK